MSSSVQGEEYRIFIPERDGQEDLDPSLGVLTKDYKNPKNREYLRNSTEVLINFSEGEAYFPSDYRIDLEQSKNFIREICEENDLEAPEAYVEVDRNKSDPPGVSWEGSYDDLFKDIWQIFARDRDSVSLEEAAVVLEKEDEDSLPGGRSRRYDAKTSTVGTDTSEDDLKFF